jgi:hypothetical protein
MWMLATFTDTEVFLATASLVPDVDWPLDLNISDMLCQLYDVYTTCLDVHGRIIPSLEEKASTCTMALCHLYCHHILQAGPYGFLGVGSGDNFVFDRMLDRTKVNPNVLLVTTKLYKLSADRPSSWKFGACSDSNLEWLSHVLPFHFVTGRVDEDVENLAITVISKLLCSPSSPSPQNIANCTLLACIMVGVWFDKKDIVWVDKRCYRLIWWFFCCFDKNIMQFCSVSTCWVSFGAITECILGQHRRWLQSTVKGQQFCWDAEQCWVNAA